MTEQAAVSVLDSLLPGETLLDSDLDELVWRQCSPKHVDLITGRPSDLLFRATDADAGQLSASRSSVCTAEKAYIHRRSEGIDLTVGTWAVTVGEVNDAGSRVVDNSRLQPTVPVPPPGHVYIDVRHMTNQRLERQRFRSVMLLRAVARGIQYPNSHQAKVVTDTLAV